MKRICCYLLLLLTATIAGQARNERKELLLNDAWTIRPISDPTPTAKGVAVTLPHTWNATYTKGTHYNRETMVYSRTLAVTPQMAEGRLFLYFEGVNSVADVFVNRKTIGQHKGGYTFIGEILRRIPPKDRKTLTTVVVDSWERGKQNYTDSIYAKFRQRFGYELDYTTPSCQNDLNHLISDLVASEYMGGLTEKAHEYGLRTWCEPYAHSPFPGNSITYGSAADEVAAEFWVNDRKFRKKEVDAALGAARSQATTANQPCDHGLAPILTAVANMLAT